MIAIVVGHSLSSPGAQLLDTLIHEFQWNDELAASLAEKLALAGIQPKVFYRDPDLPYSKAMADLCRRIRSYNGTELVLSLHFNAMPEGHRGTKSGCLALHWPGSKRGRRAAELLSAAASRAIGNRDRGARPQAKSWSGVPLYILRDTPAPAVILEPFFGGHPNDATAATMARDSGRLTDALVGAIEEFLGETP